MSSALATLLLMAGFGLLARYIIQATGRRAENEAETRLLGLLAHEQEQTGFAVPAAAKKRKRAKNGSPTVDRLAGALERSNWFARGEGQTFIERLNEELVIAGLRRKMTAYQALATALLIWAVGVVMPTFVMLAMGLPKALYVAVVLAFAAYPPMKLKSLKVSRQDSLKMELPVFIQQLRMLLSSRMSNLDDAIARVVRNAELDPYDSELAQEFGQAQTEYRLGGINREVALRGIGTRTRVVSVENLIEAIIQGLRTGVEMDIVLAEYGLRAREMWRADMRTFSARKEPLITLGMVVTMFGGFILIATPLMLNLVHTLGSFH